MLRFELLYFDLTQAIYDGLSLQFLRSLSSESVNLREGKLAEARLADRRYTNTMLSVQLGYTFTSLRNQIHVVFPFTVVVI